MRDHEHVSRRILPPESAHEILEMGIDKYSERFKRPETGPKLTEAGRGFLKSAMERHPHAPVLVLRKGKILQSGEYD